MKRPISFLIALFIFVVFLSSFKNAEAQVMSDYCQVPPYVVQNVPANVMVVVDNSGSMLNFSYSDGFETATITDNRDCSTTSTAANDPNGICSGFTNPGIYPPTDPPANYDWNANPNNYYKYYGYFNSDYWYTYSSNRFVPSAPKTGSGLTGARAKAAAEWDGNFLNWLTMRRTDIVRKVLTGGKDTSGEGSGFDRLIGENADGSGRGIYKLITVDGYVDNSYSGSRCFVFDTGTGTSSFTIRSTSSCGSSSAGGFNVAVKVPSPVQGVLQDVSTKIRMGLAFYNTEDGGHVQVSMGGTSLPATVNQVNNTKPSTWTPLAETLWTVTGYFAQQASLLSGPGPRYASGNYTINNLNDPFNYGTGGSPRWPACSKSFVLYITDGEPCHDGNLPASLLNYAAGKSQFNCTTTTCPAVTATLPETFSFPGGAVNAGDVCTGNVAGFEDVALYMHTMDLRSDITGAQNLTLYPVFVFGSNSSLLKYAAINGGFEDSNGNGIPDLQSEWDKNGDGEPDNYYEARDGSQLEQALQAAFSNMIARVASGTAASVLASGEGRGSNLVQASFYPRRRFGNDILEWIGGIQNLWYFLDPGFSQTNIREDNDPGSISILQLKKDYIMKFLFDPVTQTTKAAQWIDVNGNGSLISQATPSTIPFESVKNVWDAGAALWSRDIAADPRTLYTAITGTTLLSFTTANASTLAPYLAVTDVNSSGSNLDEAQNLISWLTGTEVIMDLNADSINDYRLRTVTIGDDTKVWKLGDILNSTPKLASFLALNPYGTEETPNYFGSPGKCIYCDSTYDDYVSSSTYTNRGVVFVGANDGMLHAFKLGTPQSKWSGQDETYEVARLINPDTGAACSPTDVNPCGKELWAFIPKNVLPYLKYIPDPDYCHVYTVDLAPVLVDASINKPASCTEADYWKCDKDSTSWSTILIGGMRQGGACRNLGTACNNDGTTTDCVKSPVNNNGYSSYFALDVTDQNNPKLLWEKSNLELPGLGFATTGPAVVRISAKDSGTLAPILTKNGRWYVVFGSGPTGPIDSAYSQFLGSSDQSLKLFILDLKTGELLRTMGDAEIGIPFAFAGSLYSSTHDMNWAHHMFRYQDDTIYIPYTMRTASSPYTWTVGGIGNLITDENLDPNQWTWRTILDNIGPVTAAVQNGDYVRGTYGNSYVFFGEGRYYYAKGTTLDDENSTGSASGRRRLFSIKHPCATWIPPAAGESDFMQVYSTCTNKAPAPLKNPFMDVTNNDNAPSVSTAHGVSYSGCFINLDPAGTYTYTDALGTSSSHLYGAERVITDPFFDTSTGRVFYTTYKPYAEECFVGGKSFIWLVDAETCGAIPSDQLQGKVLVQLSTGSIEQVDLKTALTDKQGRRSGALEGEPPRGQGIAVVSSPSGPRRVLQIRER